MSTFFYKKSWWELNHQQKRKLRPQIFKLVSGVANNSKNNIKFVHQPIALQQLLKQ